MPRASSSQGARQPMRSPPCGVRSRNFWEHQVMAKRPSLLDLASRKAQPASGAATSKSETPSQDKTVRGKSYKGSLSTIDAATWKQLKRLAAELDRPVTELQVDALNLLFRAHGLPEIATKWTPGGESLYSAVVNEMVGPPPPRGPPFS